MAELITTPYVSAAGHWYTRTGEPAYTVKGKNGTERPTTLRDARQLGLLPSVTTVTNEANAPGLNNWKENQVLLSALTLPRIEGESEDVWVERIKADAKETARKAAERGTQIHAWIQAAFEGRMDDVTPLGIEYYDAVQAALKAEYLGEVPWRVEQSFATDRFGGKVDLHDPYWRDSWTGLVMDIKTTDKPLADMKLYDSHFMQLSAYRQGLGLPHAACGIIFVSTLNRAAKVMQCEEADLQRGWRMFEALLSFWYARTGLEVNRD